MSFTADLQAQLERLSAAGWSRDQIALPTGYTRRQIAAWSAGADCKPALRTGLLVTLRGLKGRPPAETPEPETAAKPDAGPDCAVSSGSASEVWVLGLIEQLQDKLTHRIGENITLPLDLVAHVQSALISGLRAWQDQERLDWLSRKRSPGTVHLTFNGATIAKAQSVRDVIDAAMRGPNNSDAPIPAHQNHKKGN